MAPLRSVFGPIRRWLSNVKPEGEHLKRDAVAGIPVAISNVPDGMAASLLAGVNPVHGLYACFAGPIAGGLTSSTRLMVITTTSAAALAAGSALQRVPVADRTDAVILLTLLAGAALIARRHPQVGALHAVRVALGDARLPHGHLHQHHLRPDTGPHRCAERGERQPRQGHPRHHAPEPDRAGIPVRRPRRHRHPGPAEPDAAGRRRRSDRADHPDGRGHRLRPRQRGDGRRHRLDPARHSGAVTCRAWASSPSAS